METAERNRVHFGFEERGIGIESGFRGFSGERAAWKTVRMGEGPRPGSAKSSKLVRNLFPGRRYRSRGLHFTRLGTRCFGMESFREMSPVRGR